MCARANGGWAPFPGPKQPSGLTRTTLIRDSSDDMIRGQTGNTSTGIQSGPVSRTRRRPSPRRSLADPSTCKILISHCFLHLSLSLSLSPLLFFSSILSTSSSSSLTISPFRLAPSDSPAPWPSAPPPRDLSSFLVSSLALTVRLASERPLQRDSSPNILVWPLETGACAPT
ncbi:hypothetical protein BO78DRAFT_89278 [Aspergillus sclerotiicarbonarius CBS 121057]|uniref:Uncharacterized protein n=1 Tax=Aspergillus sclerotiicarbonarius (strain CBS 121057 / IBT 28362) TaxID=1448318 RepID=A0A319EBB3_ASPSB|nr:hypothetical protein BO78DRAFT_89278 [Aspergillus sclerotiicarbonarius CBS 121057]